MYPFSIFLIMKSNEQWIHNEYQECMSQLNFVCS